MQDIVILPIFNQAAPGVWDDFAHIRVSSVESIYNSIYDADDIDGMIYADKKKWGKRFVNFAFGAYLGSEMVGFIQGDAHGRCANIQSLYVLKEYQKLGVGHRLLSRAERAASIFAKRIELVALSKAEPFYIKNGYSSQYGTNRYEKLGIQAPRCECLPIFRCNSRLEKKCKMLEPSFDAGFVNVSHLPMFVYYNVDSELCGYAIGGTKGDPFRMVFNNRTILAQIFQKNISRYEEMWRAMGR